MTCPVLSRSLVMFYFIALAGAHKRVVDQLREQLSLVSEEASLVGHGWGHSPRMLYEKWHFSRPGEVVWGSQVGRAPPQPAHHRLL